MNSEQKDMVVADHFKEFCNAVALEVGTAPVAAVLILEWPDSNGSLAVQMLPDLSRPMMLKVIDSLQRKFTGSIQRMRTMVNTQKADGSKGTVQ